MAEWLKAAVLKTAVGSRPPGVRIPPSPPVVTSRADITMNDIAFKSPHPYHLTIAALDAVRADYSAYFSPLLSNKSLLDIKLPGVHSILEKALNATQGSEKLKCVKLVNQQIAQTAIVLPLYQEVRKFYFPKRIKNLRLGENDLEYIEIGELKI